MSIQSDKIELVQMVLSINDKSLIKKVKSVIQAGQPDFWDELDNEVKADVLEAIKELDNGGGKPHKQVMKKHEKWLKK